MAPSMTENQLRALVRDIVARHVNPDRAPVLCPDTGWKSHASHLRLPVLTGQQGDGPCVIEPAVPCNHCGYCQSFGH